MPSEKVWWRRLWSRWGFLLAVVVFGVGADQITKAWATSVLQPLSPDYIRVIDGFFNLRYAENYGAAWGLLSDLPEAWRVIFFTSVGVLALGLVGMFLHRTPTHARRLMVGLVLVFAGAIGNLVDRVRLGYVVDFIDMYAGAPPWLAETFVRWFNTNHWPTFNLADTYISVGVAIMLFEMTFGDEEALAGLDGRPPATAAAPKAEG